MIGLTLMSCLIMIQNQNLSVVRSQAWNGAMGLAEAGVEEALAQLNPGAVTNTVEVNLGANGWGPPSAGAYGPVARTLADGTYAVSYTTASAPVIISAGSVALPWMSATLTRTLRVTTTNVALCNVAFGAVNSVTMHGNGLAADSFDSGNTNLSTNGQYDSSKTSTNGNVASVNGPVDLGNHSIAGNLYLGPNAQYDSSTGQVSGTIYNDFNVDYPDVVLPNVTFFPAPSTTTTINGTSYNHVFTSSRNYVVTDSGSIYVGTNVNVTVEVTASSWDAGSVNIAGSAGNSGNLTVFMTGTSTTLGGNTTVNSGVAGNFMYFGLPSNTSVTVGGNSSYVGVIYAPEAVLTLNGGGNNNGFIGSCIVNSITMNGHYDFHYDQALGRTGPARGYLATSWQEL